MDVARVDMPLRDIPKMQFSMFGVYTVLPDHDFKVVLALFAQVDRSTTIWPVGPLDVMLKGMLKSGREGS